MHTKEAFESMMSVN